MGELPEIQELAAQEPRAASGTLSLYETARAFQTLLENLPGMVYRCANDDRWTMYFSGGRCAALTGYPPEAFLMNRKVSYVELIHPEDRQTVRSTVDAALEQRQSFQITYRIHTADGSEKHVFEQGCGVFDAQGNLEALEGYITDITPQRNLERELAQAAKLETVGQLSCGIAHDLNNILTAIVSLGTFIYQASDSDSSSQKDASDILDGARRAAHLTRQVLAFSKRQIVQPQTFEVDSNVSQLDKLLRRLLGGQVNLVTRLDAAGACITADPGQFEQIIVNLVVNSRDAMPDGGTITLRTTLEDGDGAPARVVLSVNDTGHGISESIRERIFDPFFTTKAAKGTGLGLATVRTIVEGLGGTLHLQSAIGAGTTFTATLPLAEAPETRAGDSSPPAPAPRGHEGVVVVDDDHQVRRSVARILRQQGYEVQEAPTPTEALVLIERGRNRVKLLITDVVMPSLSGPETLRIARRTYPGLRVLFISGYATPPSEAHELPEAAGLLAKPFTPDALLHRVREILDTRPD